MIVKNVKTDILKALAKYKYLTASQVVEIEDISTKLGTVRKALTELRNKELIGSIGFSGSIQVENSPKPKVMNFERFNFLTKKGVEFLEDLRVYNAKYPKYYQTEKIPNDYIHRLEMVSVCISFEKWRKEKDIKGLFLIDFHNSETKIMIDEKLTVKPDIIVNFNQNYAIIEVWAGREKEYILNQLSQFTKAVASKKVSEFLKYDRIPRIFNVFDNKAVMERVKQEILTDTYFESAVKNSLFHFATIDDIKRKFNFWQDIKGNWLDIEQF